MLDTVDPAWVCVADPHDGDAEPINDGGPYKARIQIGEWVILTARTPEGFERCEQTLPQPVGALFDGKCMAQKRHEHPHIGCCDTHPVWRTDSIVQVYRKRKVL